MSFIKTPKPERRTDPLLRDTPELVRVEVIMTREDAERIDAIAEKTTMSAARLAGIIIEKNMPKACK